MPESCNGCFHCRNIQTLDGTLKACHYALDFGVLRGCPASECKKFTAEEPVGMPKFLRGF